MSTHVVSSGGQYEFAAWPANGSIHAWGDELLVGYTAGHWARSYAEGTHHLVRGTVEYVQSRSLDGGSSWSRESEDIDASGVVGDFMAWGFAFRGRMTHHTGGPSFSLMSSDKGKTWTKQRLPSFGFASVMARSDFHPDGPSSGHALLTVTKESTGYEGRVVCARTTDGGHGWGLAGKVGTEPPPGDGFRIMPSTVLTADGYLCAVRRSYGEGSKKGPGFELYRSRDMKRWRKESALDVGYKGEKGNPPHLLEAGGLLVLTYGVRREPYPVVARVSDDAGRTWSPARVIEHCHDWDMGYVRSCVNLKGQVVTAYYDNDAASERSSVKAVLWTL